MIGEVGFQLLATALYARFETFGEAPFLEVAQHQVFHVVPKAFFHHVVDAFVAKDGEFAVLDGKVDEHAIAQLGFVELQAVEDIKAAFFDVASTMVLDVHFDFSRGVQLGLLDGFHDAAVFLSVQYGDGVRHNRSFDRKNSHFPAKFALAICFGVLFLFLCKPKLNQVVMMKPRNKRIVLILAMMFASVCMKAQNEAPAHKGLLSDYPKKLIVELKAGQGFLGDRVGEEGTETKVFAGGGGLSYGVLLRNNFVGLGASYEYVDMLQGSHNFPVYLNLQHYLSKEAGKGFFVGAKVGYILGGKTSIPILKYVSGQEVNGTADRSMKGPYGELSAGYAYRGINFFASYNYRVINYETTIYPNNMYFGVPYSTSSRVMHTLMFGFSFVLF